MDGNPIERGQRAAATKALKVLCCQKFFLLLLLSAARPSQSVSDTEVGSWNKIEGDLRERKREGGAGKCFAPGVLCTTDGQIPSTWTME